MDGQAILSRQYHCTGFYVQTGRRTAMTLDVSITGPVITGEGHDAVGRFAIHGAISSDGSTVSFGKRYAFHSIEYTGTLVDGTKIVGVWRFPGGDYDSGAFALVLEPLNEVPLVDKALWKGHYTQFGREHATEQELVIYASGRIEGGGRDTVGGFTISGRFLQEGVTMGPFIYTKKYNSHAISYEGVREGAVMTGIYQSRGTGRGSFTLQAHSSRL